MQTKTVWCNSINQRRCDMLKVGFLIAKNPSSPDIMIIKTRTVVSRFSYPDNKWFTLFQLFSCVQLFVTPWTAACQASLSIIKSQSLLKLMSIESVMPSNHLILCHPLLLLPSIFPSTRVFSYQSVCIRWPKYWSFSFSSSLSNDYSGMICFRIDWFDLLTVKRTLQSLQHHSSKILILWCSPFFIV